MHNMIKIKFTFIDLNGKNISSLNIKINEHEIIKEGTFSMPQEDENCCEWLIKQITKKPNRRGEI